MESTIYQKKKDEINSVEEAYNLCEKIGTEHYENFTVVSRLIPQKYRKHIYALYAYSRYTDDLGDELKGNRLKALDQWEKELTKCFEEDTQPEHPILMALRETVKNIEIEKTPFLKLIEANRMDQQKDRYETYDDLLEYCDHSANPVGRVFLAIFGYHDERRRNLSDKTCTGLQLTNFWQDVWRDYKMGRVYIPEEDMKRFGYSRSQIADRNYNEKFVSLMKLEVSRARKLLEEGLKLPSTLDGRSSLDVELFNRGGLAILDKIEEINYNVLNERPTLSRAEKVKLFLTSYLKSFIPVSSK